jgi:hypothetical protein
MVTQYPYKLFVFESQEHTRDQKGNIVQGDSQWVLVSKCRDEKANARQIRLEDSSIYISNLVVFLPRNCPLVTRRKVEVRGVNGLVRAEGTVKEFDSGQLNSRIWL